LVPEFAPYEMPVVPRPNYVARRSASQRSR
jgi:hypothetical protein